jgi:hypothetical protein
MIEDEEELLPPPLEEELELPPPPPPPPPPPDETGIRVKVAIQALLAVIVTTPLVLQSPLQEVKVEPESGVDVAVTTVPLLYVLAPPTVPVPVPALVMVRV